MERREKRALAFLLAASLLCLALCLSLLPGTAWANGDGGVAYIERG